jgi:ATP-dependent helicase/nuclease subunit A
MAPRSPDIIQREAADPAASVWVSASAGTGKTKVLTDRVLTLLLSGTQPSRILCLTYTRAAAAEMAIRVGDALGQWARADDNELEAAIIKLTGTAPDVAQRARARLLFGQVLDCPGGLRIQTIHAFCESLLRRFPIEAGLAPHFRVLDDHERRNLLAASRDEVLSRAIGVDGDDDGDDIPQELLSRAVAIAGRSGAERFDALLERLTFERGRVTRALETHGGLNGARAAIFTERGLDPDETEAAVIEAACREEAFDGAALRDALKVMLAGLKTDKDHAEKYMAPWLGTPERRVELWDAYLRGFLKADGDPYKAFITGGALKKVADADAHLDAMAAECGRLQFVEEKRRRIRTAEGSSAALTLGAALNAAYERRKQAAQRLDYDDLILATRGLLSSSDSTAWVLYKLDGGIDHVLVDEAQDTSPEQWDVIRALTAEFFAGRGAREDGDAPGRTVFAVGDAKQSIYSFQHADPRAFAEMRDHFGASARAGGVNFRDLGLHHSFRSTRPVLATVDRIFANSPARDGVAAGDETITHETQREGQAGQVELWPLMTAPDRAAVEAWSPGGRGDDKAAGSAESRLAMFLAARIREWIGTFDLSSRGRKLEPRDVMVLVRRRTAFVDLLVRALKRVDVPVAGVDRMKLAGELAVRDLLAVGRFLLLPEDDYTLACVLKGPFIGLDDADLLALAPRRDGSLWAALNARANESRAWRAARARLAALAARTDFDRPFELFTAVLDEDEGRARLVARLGAEAEDPINEFLELALAFERAGTPSLEGFLAWFDGGQSEIKRDLEQAERNEVRIMTVHGAKGLQAPVVILPDTQTLPRPPEGPFWEAGADGVALPVWAPRTADLDGAGRALRDSLVDESLREYHRLLYVALTRAEDALFVTGWKGLRGGDGCWHQLVADGLKPIAEETPFDFTGYVPGFEGTGYRYHLAQGADPDRGKDTVAPGADAVALEGWETTVPAPAPDVTESLTPSHAGDDEGPLLSPLGGAGGDPFLRGQLVHGLLELLPGLDPAARIDAARRFLDRPEVPLDDAAREQIAEETLAVLADSAFASLFGPDSLAEVPVTGRIDGHIVSGQIDRLVASGEDVLCVDYKTSRPVPRDDAGVVPAYLRQMALYRAVLVRVFPGKRVRCALLYTAAPVLIELSDARLDAALAELDVPATA